MLTAEIKVNGRRISLVKVQNDGTGTDEIGNYRLTLIVEGKPERFSRIEGWDRTKLGHELIMEALKKFDDK